VVALRALGRAYVRRRYAILFYVLLITIAGRPLADALGRDADVLELLLGSSLLAAVLPIGNRYGRLSLLFVLLAGWASSVWFDRPIFVTGSLATFTIIALIAAANALGFALRASSIDGEHLYAALGAYVLVGIFFGIVYWLLEETWTASFSVAGGGTFSRANAIYFSFVTLTTLGYGEVVPRSEVARGFVMVEAVVGQLYLAVMVARLVSLYAPRDRGGEAS
jgi:voltage-gated potassium channel Kch